jgi:quercetin dioxygenase-like cupin family protein
MPDPNQIKEGTMATATMTQRTAEDPVKVDPKHYKVEFENDRVRVLRIKYNPGEKSVMHGHPESIGVFLTDIQGRFIYPDGRSEDIEAKAGSVQHMDALTHLPESTSKEPFEAILVELKR